MIPYIKDNFRGGISDEYTRGLKGTWKYSYGLDIHKRRDSLSCNLAMSNIANSSIVNDLIKYRVVARDGSTYCFGSAGSVYAIAGNTQDPVVTFVYNDENGAIKGAGEWKQSDGNTYLMWATDTSIARMTFNGSPDLPLVAGVVNANYKTDLQSADQHPFKQATGNMLIGNKGFLALIDYDGGYNSQAMNLRPGNIIKALEERDDYALMGSERLDESEEGHIWSWISTALNWVQKKKIPVKGVNALIDTELLLLQGGNAGEIFSSDFSSSAPLNSLPDGAGQVNPEGVSIYNDLALFGFYGCNDPAQVGIYSIGRRMRNRPFAFNHEFRLTRTVAGSTIAEIGSVWVASSAVFASWKTIDGSTIEYGVDMSSSSTRAFARYEGLEFTGGSPHLKKQYNSEKLVIEPLPAGTALSVLFRPSRATDGGSESAGPGWKYARVASGPETTFTTQGATEAEFIINDKAKVFEIAYELTPNGSSTPEITAAVGYLGDKTLEH